MATTVARPPQSAIPTQNEEIHSNVQQQPATAAGGAGGGAGAPQSPTVSTVTWFGRVCEWHNTAIEKISTTLHSPTLLNCKIAEGDNILQKVGTLALSILTLYIVPTLLCGIWDLGKYLWSLVCGRTDATQPSTQSSTETQRATSGNHPPSADSSEQTRGAMHSVPELSRKASQESNDSSDEPTSTSYTAAKIIKRGPAAHGGTSMMEPNIDDVEETQQVSMKRSFVEDYEEPSSPHVERRRLAQRTNFPAYNSSSYYPSYGSTYRAPEVNQYGLGMSSQLEQRISSQEAAQRKLAQQLQQLQQQVAQQSTPPRVSPTQGSQANNASSTHNAPPSTPVVIVPPGDNQQ